MFMIYHCHVRFEGWFGMVWNGLAPFQAEIVEAAQRGHVEAQTLCAEQRRSVNHLLIQFEAEQRINCLFFSHCSDENM